MAMADCLRCGGRITSRDNGEWIHLDEDGDDHEARPAGGNTAAKPAANFPPISEAPRLDL